MCVVIESGIDTRSKVDMDGFLEVIKNVETSARLC